MLEYGRYKNYYRNHVPKEINKELLRHIFRGYLAADKLIKSQEYQPGPAKNLYPYVRWANIDNYCLALNQKYDELESISRPNVVKNSFHTLIRYGNIRMTISAVQSRNSLPRDAQFRNDLASCQYSWGIDEKQGIFKQNPLASIDSKIVYAFIVHGTETDNPQYPEFVNIVFPNSTCTKYLDYIDLFKEYPDFVEELLHEDMEHIKDNAGVELKVDSRQEKLL